MRKQLTNSLMCTHQGSATVHKQFVLEENLMTVKDEPEEDELSESCKQFASQENLITVKTEPEEEETSEGIVTSMEASQLSSGPVEASAALLRVGGSTHVMCLVQLASQKISTVADLLVESRESGPATVDLDKKQLTCEVQVQTDLFSSDIVSMKKRIETLQKERNALLNLLSSLERQGWDLNFYIDTLKNSDEKCKFYTRLLYLVVMILYRFLSPFVKKFATAIKTLDEMF